MSYMHTKIRKIVRDTLKARFPKIKISQIQIEEELDEDDTRIISIKVIFEAQDNFSAADFREVPRLLIPQLESVNERGFPVVSFISKSDWGDTKTAAA